MKTSLNKKKKSKNTEKENNTSKGNEKVGDVKTNIREINAKYEPVFKEVGLELKDHCIFSVPGDGGCGSHCTSIHCHRDKKLGRYVRRNINKYLVKFWPFFLPSFLFPINVNVGSKIEPFEDENSFLLFLENNPQSVLMWMDHYGWQVVSNMYQISVHILTTGVEGRLEPRARWTHLEPDSRLSSFSEAHQGLPDMWVMHDDEIHFDLLIRKDSGDLTKKGCVD